MELIWKVYPYTRCSAPSSTKLVCFGGVRWWAHWHTSAVSCFLPPQKLHWPFYKALRNCLINERGEFLANRGVRKVPGWKDSRVKGSTPVFPSKGLGKLKQVYALTQPSPYLLAGVRALSQYVIPRLGMIVQTFQLQNKSGSRNRRAWKLGRQTPERTLAGLGSDPSGGPATTHDISTQKHEPLRRLAAWAATWSKG